MPTINQLPLVTQLSGGDNLVLWVPNQGDSRRCSITTLLQYFTANFQSPDSTTVIITPTVSGFNYNVGNITANLWLIINPSAPFASGGITLPSFSQAFDGLEISVVTTQAIASFVTNGNGANVIGEPGSLGAGGFFTLKYSQAQTTWYTLSVNQVETFSTPVLGTPASGNLVNCTNLPIGSGVSGLGTGVATALAVNVGSVGAAVVNGGALGTPASGTLTNCSGLPIASGVSGLGSGVASALAIAVGAAGGFVEYNDDLGTPSAGNLQNCTSLPLASGVTGSLPVSNGGTGASANVQNLSGPGAVDVTSLVTAFSSTGTGDVLTLADGVAGQIKNIVYVAEAAGADTGILTPVNFGNGTTITFTNVGDSCQIQFIGSEWWVIALNGATVA